MSVLSQAAQEKACSPKRMYTFLAPRLATEPYPPLQFLATGHCRWTVGPSRPSLVRATPPATPPCSDAAVRARRQLVCQRPGGNATKCARLQLASDSSVPARLPQFESRITNHESRITNHGRPGPPLCGGTPPATPPCSDAAVCARFQLAADTSVPARLPQFDSRLTTHDSRITAAPALPCPGDTPSNAPL